MADPMIGPMRIPMSAVVGLEDMKLGAEQRHVSMNKKICYGRAKINALADQTAYLISRMEYLYWNLGIRYPEKPEDFFVRFYASLKPISSRVPHPSLGSEISSSPLLPMLSHLAFTIHTSHFLLPLTRSFQETQARKKQILPCPKVRVQRAPTPPRTPPQPLRRTGSTDDLEGEQMAMPVETPTPPNKSADIPETQPENSQPVEDCAGIMNKVNATIELLAEAEETHRQALQILQKECEKVESLKREAADDDGERGEEDTIPAGEVVIGGEGPPRKMQKVGEATTSASGSSSSWEVATSNAELPPNTQDWMLHGTQLLNVDMVTDSLESLSIEDSMANDSQGEKEADMTPPLDL